MRRLPLWQLGQVRDVDGDVRRFAAARTNGDDLALRGLSLRSVRHDDASVPWFTVKP